LRQEVGGILYTCHASRRLTMLLQLPIDSGVLFYARQVDFEPSCLGELQRRCGSQLTAVS